MIQFDLPKQQSSIIKVIGVGGGGSNAVNYMHSLGIESVDFLVCNTDAQALALSQVPNKIQLGPSLTQGLGAGANPEIGRQATQESLEEIRRILEVNTKMAFVTAGMGGGTGTGGAPIIAKICRDMGILTVGIVTTPFSYEGKKRYAYANEGINQLKSCVDTLLVISNDKLRHQFGNLTMSAALSTADNVLATAAKCITDVINTTGQINVDFADVCTVMRNGGVAILGSAKASGEHRSQLAIEQALNSPLLNDNDISGAKWVLININSSAGEHEFTMDEVETIQEYLLTQAGPDADVILGLGYDESLGDQIGITIIATGFDQKTGTDAAKPLQQQAPEDEKIMLTLEVAQKISPEALSSVQLGQEAIADGQLVSEATDQHTPVELASPVSFGSTDGQLQPYEMTVGGATNSESDVQEAALFATPAIPFHAVVAAQGAAAVQEASIEVDASPEQQMPIVVSADAEGPIVFELSLDREDRVELIVPKGSIAQTPVQQEAEHILVEQDAPNTVDLVQATAAAMTNPAMTNPMPVSAASNGFLVKPAVIYVIENPPASPSLPFGEKELDANSEDLFELVFHEEVSQAVSITPVPEELMNVLNESAPFDEAEAQRAKAAERLHKLRNLSYNFNAADPNNEYDSVPAYVRHNLLAHNTTLASVEKFYSSYAVGMDENNVAQISTINTFLEGKKPD